MNAALCQIDGNNRLMLKDDIRRIYCKREYTDAISEFGENPCFRFFGVVESQFNADAFGEGILSITLEADSSTTVLCPPGVCRDEDCPLCRDRMDSWFQIDYQVSDEGKSSIFPTFGLVAPRKVNITAISAVSGPVLPKFPDYKQPNILDKSGPFGFSSFEVGQGMASVAYNPSHAFIIDAGAGTPITRTAYCNGTLTSNDLASCIAGRQARFFLSHGDSDHWRILSWDPSLHGQIVEFVVPDGMRPIAFFDKTIKHKVFQLKHDVVFNFGQSSLALYRSQPDVPKSNNDGLIAVFSGKKQLVLVPGDCVYAEMLHDSNSAVAALPANLYTGVVVPHHGDSASANNVPRGVGKAKAFFSAGNHSGYNHPVQASVDAHVANGFVDHVNKYPTGITEVPLT